jgi:GNAT superfamily N-acetyltransferase
MMADSITYRKEVIPEDRLAVGRLVRTTGFFSEEEIGIAVELVEERLAKGDVSGYFFLFAEAGDRLIGYACFGPIPGTLHSFDLYWIAVDPGEQGRGVGRKLMAMSETLMAQRGGMQVYADTSSRPQYEPTRAFYPAAMFRKPPSPISTHRATAKSSSSSSFPRNRTENLH